MLVSSTISRDAAALTIFNGGCSDFYFICGTRVDRNYTVQAGDNLWNVAQKIYGSTMEFSYQDGELISLPLAIARENGLHGYKLSVGQELRIPFGEVVGPDIFSCCPTGMETTRPSEYEDVRELGGLSFFYL